MAVPNHTTIAADLYEQLNAQLVTGSYASKVRRAAMKSQELPGPTELPAVVYTLDADYEETDSGDQALVQITVYVVRHMQAGVGESDELVFQVSAALHRWTPSITGIGTSPLRRIRSGDGQYDTEHVAEVMTFEAYLSEG